MIIKEACRAPTLAFSRRTGPSASYEHTRLCYGSSNSLDTLPSMERSLPSRSRYGPIQALGDITIIINDGRVSKPMDQTEIYGGTISAVKL